MPIVGLVHHGSGPSYTSLLDPEFPEKLATFAGAVARRYPWVTAYTPVNEPLTTARFSCLVWSLVSARPRPVNFRAGFASRSVAQSCSRCGQFALLIPPLSLIQTEDLGKTFSTPTLAYQAEFENERRWLTFDLLCGRITSGTPMWDYFTWLGMQRSELEWFSENQTSPDIAWNKSLHHQRAFSRSAPRLDTPLLFMAATDVMRTQTSRR